MVVAQGGQQVNQAGMVDLPQPGDDLGLGRGRDLGEKLGDHVTRVGLLQQAGPEIDQQPGAVLRLELARKLAIAEAIQQTSYDILRVEEGSLYPALQRLLLRGWVKAEWKKTETNRRARFYTLTPAGRKQLGAELSQFEQMIAAIGRVLQDA